MVGIQLVFLVKQPKASVAVKNFFREVGEELLEDATTINTHPVRNTSTYAIVEIRHICSLLFTELIYE